MNNIDYESAFRIICDTVNTIIEQKQLMHKRDEEYYNGFIDGMRHAKHSICDELRVKKDLDSNIERLVKEADK